MLKTIDLSSKEFEYSTLPGYQDILNSYKFLVDKGLKKRVKFVKNDKTVDEVREYQYFLYTPEKWKELLNKDSSELNHTEIQKISIMKKHSLINSKINYYLNNDINFEDDLKNAIEIYDFMKNNSPREILLPKLSEKDRDFVNYILKLCEYGEDNIFDYEFRDFFASKYIEKLKNGKANIIERFILWSIKEMNRKVEENRIAKPLFSEGYLKARASSKQRTLYNAKRSNCY